MDEVTESRVEVRETKIEVDLLEDKVDFINYAYEKGLQYWKRAALESVSTENEARELIELAPRKVILVSKAKNQKFDNVEDRTFIPSIRGGEPSFEAITDNLKPFSK